MNTQVKTWTSNYNFDNELIQMVWMTRLFF